MKNKINQDSRNQLFLNYTQQQGFTDIFQQTQASQASTYNPSQGLALGSRKVVTVKSMNMASSSMIGKGALHAMSAAKESV